MRYRILVISRFGIEKITANELRRLGYDDYAISDGEIVFEGDLYDAARANMFLRTAERVLLILGEFKAISFEELFQGTKKIPWGEMLPEDAFIHVTAKSFKSELFSISDIQSISKKAIIEKMSRKYKKKWFEESGERYRIEIGIYNNKVSVMLDTSGEGLHKRGYRRLATEAPVSETLAAAMILISYWNFERTLMDPFCGSGTIPIEAAMIGMEQAPGMKRDFAAMKYHKLFDKKCFTRAREEAEDKVKRDRELKILGSDIDDDIIRKARYHSQLAGVEDKLHLQTHDVKDVSSNDKYGILITNPPYGERMMESEQIEPLYRDMKKCFDRLDTWSIYILSAYKGFETVYGARADKRRKLYNGMLECQYYQYFGPRPPRTKG